MKSLVRLTVLLCVLTGIAYGKRTPPPVVPPIAHEGVTYTASGDGQANYIVATDAASGKELWRTRVYHVRIDPAKETDVQTVFISGMRLSGNFLLIRNEMGRCYRLDLAKHSVKRDACTEYDSLKPKK